MVARLSRAGGPRRGGGRYDDPQLEVSSCTAPGECSQDTAYCCMDVPVRSVDLRRGLIEAKVFGQPLIRSTHCLHASRLAVVLSRHLFLRRCGLGGTGRRPL